MIIEIIKKELENGGVLSENTLNTIKKLETDLETTKLELSKLEVINKDVIESRDKIKQLNNLFKKELSFDENQEITENVIKEKIDKKTTTDKLEIRAVENQIIKLKTEYEQELKNKEETLFKKDIDLEILKNGQKINCISPIALNVIMNELKKDAIIEDNKIIYKSNGEIIRKDGLPITLVDKIEELKKDENYKGFFIAETQSGSGFKSKTSQGNIPSVTTGKPTDAVVQRMKERAEKLNIQI